MSRLYYDQITYLLLFDAIEVFSDFVDLICLVKFGDVILYHYFLIIQYIDYAAVLKM